VTRPQLSGVLQRELASLERELQVLEARRNHILALLDTYSGAPMSSHPKNGSRRMNRLSAEGRKKISEVMKKRWAEYRKERH
jgi:hypothetical protein